MSALVLGYALAGILLSMVKQCLDLLAIFVVWRFTRHHRGRTFLEFYDWLR